MAIHILHCPSGKFAFVGNVPFELAFDAKGIDASEARACMSQTIAAKLAARRGGYLKTRVFDTREAAAEFAAAHGFAIERAQ